MRLFPKMLAIAMTFTMAMSFSSFAKEIVWKTASEKDNGSALLSSGETYSENIYQGVTRGEFLSTAALQITNMQNGQLQINIDTYAHHDVDEIYHTLFLDQWDDDLEEWRQIDRWDFSRTKEEAEAEGQELYMLATTLVLDGREVNQYYRARGLHGVEYNNEVEAKATRTNGVLLTDWQ